MSESNRTAGLLGKATRMVNAENAMVAMLGQRSGMDAMGDAAEIAAAYIETVASLQTCVAEFDRIDALTPWRETEPAWWLAWSEVARKAREALATT